MDLPARDSELVQIMDAALLEVAARAKGNLACRIGCTQCCYGAFAINSLDALRLNAGMKALSISDPERHNAIEDRARTWVREHAPAFPGDAKTGALGESPQDQERFEDFANHAACPALDPATGRCDVYAYRPMTCRVFGPPVRMGDGDALGHCELCFAGASEEEVAACEMPVPHEFEAELIEQLGEHQQTVVGYALLRPAANCSR